MTDYYDADFDEGCSGFYRIWYRRTTPPSGPHWSIRDMASALRMTDYPDDGYVIWYQEGEGLSNVPSLNPDDLLIPEGEEVDLTDDEMTIRFEDAYRHRDQHTMLRLLREKVRRLMGEQTTCSSANNS